MWLFVDESWSPAEHRPRIGVLFGILVRDEDLQTYDNLLYSVRKKYFGRDHAKDPTRELKGRMLLSNQVLRKHSRATPMKNVNVVKELLYHPQKTGTYLRVVASTVYREDERAPTLLCPDPKSLALPFRRIVESASLAAASDPKQRSVKLVFDQRMGAQQGIAIAVRNFVMGLGLPAVHPYPYFAVSNVSPGVQMADVFASILCKRAQKVGGYLIKDLYTVLRRLQWTAETPPSRYGLNRFTESGRPPDLHYKNRTSW